MTDESSLEIRTGDLVKKAHQLDGDIGKIQDFYREWAQSYDQDLVVQEYAGPAFLADFLVETAKLGVAGLDLGSPQVPILDAGCGTGLVAVALKDRGYQVIDGCDISEDMAKEARATGAYRQVLGTVDLCGSLDAYADRQYGAVVSCGVFTLGHVPPSALRQVARITRPGGVIAVSTRISYYEESDFAYECDRMAAAGLFKLVHKALNAPYIKDQGAHYWAYRCL